MPNEYIIIDVYPDVSSAHIKEDWKSGVNYTFSSEKEATNSKQYKECQNPRVILL